MNRNQVLVVAACLALCIGIYLFAGTKNPNKETAPVVEAAESSHEQPQQETLDIGKYMADITSQLPDSTEKNKISQLFEKNDFKPLINFWQKKDKPIAVAYFTVRLAEQQNTANSYVNAGDYNTLLSETAPDAKAHTFLTTNALDCYKKAVELDSANTDYKIRLAGAYMEGGGAPMQGVGILLEIVRKDSANIPALLMLGRFGIISGQFDKAIARLEKIIYLQPENSEALLLMAQAYEGQGNKAQAIEMLEKCKKTLPDAKARKEVDAYIEKIKKPNG